KRLGMALVLMALFHLVAIPAVLLSFHYRPGAAPEVALVRIPAREWDAAMERAGTSADSERRTEAGRRPKESEAAAKTDSSQPEERRKPEEPPGQVVETAPGDDRRPDDPSFAAESDNTVERQTIARDRRPAPVTTPRSS